MKNNKKTKYAIMMVGKTHSGKTTSGYKLEKRIDSAVVIQTDPISLFLKENFSVNLNKDYEHDGSFKNPSLKYKIFKTIIKHVAENTNYIPILANSNMHQKTCTEMINFLHEKSFLVIGIYLNLQEDVLFNRIEKANRDVKSLNFHKSFKETLIRQRVYFIEPKNEFDFFFEAKGENEILNIENEIIKLTKKTLPKRSVFCYNIFIMKEEKILIIIKPDAIVRGLVGEVFNRFERKGFKIIGTKMIQLGDVLLDDHYSHLADKPFFQGIKNFMTVSPVMLIALSGVNASAAARLIAGQTAGHEADAGTIRGDFSMSIQSNIVHVSDTPENGEIEVKRFFNDDELFTYKRADEVFVYSDVHEDF